MIQKREALRIARAEIQRCGADYGLPVRDFTSDAKKWIKQRRWQDSAEIRRAVCFAALVSKGPEIDRGDFPLCFPVDHEAFSRRHLADIGLSEIVRQKFAHFLNRVGDEEVEGVYSSIVDQVERAVFELAWKRSGECQSKVARMLGVHRNTVRQKLEKLGLLVAENRNSV